MSKIITRVGLGAILGVAVLLLAGCDDVTSVNNPVPKPVAPQVEPLTDTVVLRSAAKNNGENSRVLRKDRNGVVREIVVNYEDKRQGLISKDVDGNITSLKMKMPDHSTMEGKPTADGKTVSEGKHFTVDGKLKVSFTPQKNEGYQSDGVSLRFVGTTTSSGTSWKLYASDGKTLVAEEEDSAMGGLRPSQKLYDASGVLMYDEKMTSATSTDSWGAKIYFGTVFDAQGKATHRVTVQQGPYDNGGGYVQQVEEFDTDGVTVKKTTGLNRWYSTPMKIGVFASQDALMSAKSVVWSTINEDKRGGAQIVTQLSGLLIP